MVGDVPESERSRRERPLRIGAVSYLNSKPLIHGLTSKNLTTRLGDTELVLDYPSRLADDLAAARLDVALIPSIEYFHTPGYEIVSDACIACRGAVLSVKLFCRRPAAELRSLALDEGSRTSAALVQILLQEKHGLAPELQPLSIGASVADCDADAVLLIGDRAIHAPPGDWCEVWDLGDEWCRSTELPFVFAMWVARAGIEIQPLATVLGEVRDQGVAELDTIVATESAALGMTRPQCESYLRDNLHFRLGEAERSGLERFRRQAAQYGLLPGFEEHFGDARESTRVG